MGFMANLKAQKAYKKHSNGEWEEARVLYEEAISEGMNLPRYLLAYSVLLLRTGEYQKAREILVKTQKAPGLMPEQRVQLFTNYAAAVFRLGELDKGISILEKQHLHNPSGLVYNTLGYLYVEKYDQANTPDFDAMERAAALEAAAQASEEAVTIAEGTPEEAAEETAPAVEEVPAEPALSPREAWAQGIEKARTFLQEALDYDDEDPVSLDNMGQFLYRVMGDREAAKPWFEKALRQKEGQIDTLWFLSRYDLEEGNAKAAREKLEKALEGKFSPLNYVNKEKIQAELKQLR